MWDYRVVHRYYPLWDEHTYGIFECYYDADGNPEMLTEDCVGAFGNTLEELRSDLKNYVTAIDKPVLLWDDIVKGNDDE